MSENETLNTIDVERLRRRLRRDPYRFTPPRTLLELAWIPVPVSDSPPEAEPPVARSDDVERVDEPLVVVQPERPADHAERVLALAPHEDVLVVEPLEEHPSVGFEHAVLELPLEEGV